MMYPSHSYEAQMPGTQMQMGSFGMQVNPAPGSFGQNMPMPMQQPSPYDMRAASMGRQDYVYPAAPVPHQYVSADTYAGPGPSGTRAPECGDDECAEEECDPDQCGDENRAPAEDRGNPCGLDTRPLLPIGLMVTTLLGGICMLVCQLPVLNSLIGGYEFVLGMFIAIFAILYLVTLGTTVYCTLADPGQLRRDYQQRYTAMEQLNQGQPPAENKWPKRAHKTWLYRQPVRRYDHYCRWVTNCIGLLNHREFFIMVAGLVLIAVLGTAIDLVALIAVFSRGTWPARVAVILHIFYSVVLMFLAGPILRIHVGLVCRNELANEWKRNDFYVVTGKHGGKISVNELSDEEFNARFDHFEYDPQRNSFDKGWADNCWSFWCIPRWPQHQMGEF